jgi:hypothetical protein
MDQLEKDVISSKTRKNETKNFKCYKERALGQEKLTEDEK